MEGKRGRDVPAAAENPDAKLSVPAEITPDGTRRRIGGQKRKSASSLFGASPASSSISKRLVKERNTVPILPSGHNGPCTRARQFPGKAAAGSPPTPLEGAAIAETVVGEVCKEMIFPEDPVKSVEETVEPPDAPAADEEFEAVRSRGVGVHVVPTSAGWFSWEKIHEIEKHALPSFFNGQSENKTPEIYIEIRNSIMKKFHVNPQTPLEVKDLPEISAGELEFRQEVMEFLDYWGLINFHPLPQTISDTKMCVTGSEKTSSLLDQLYRFENEESLICRLTKKQESSPPTALLNLIPESSILDEMMWPVDPSVEYHCNSCSADCSRRRYHCQKQADFDLCAECYNNAKFGLGMTLADFILMESAEGPGVSSQSWTDQETILLLEALELFGENWNEIAEHVATKTKAQCMLHFLQMPIKDPFLEVEDNSNDNMAEKVETCSAIKDSFTGNAFEGIELENGMSSNQPASSLADAEVDPSCENNSDFAIRSLRSAFEAVGLTIEEDRPLSFAEAGNPVMVLAAFLARLVEQDAASTSSRSSLKSLLEDSPGTHLVSRHCFILEEPPNNGRSPLAPESAVAAVGDSEAFKEEEELPHGNGSAESKNGTSNDQTNTAPEQSETKPSASSNQISQNFSTNKDLNDAVLPISVTSGSSKHSDVDSKPLPEEPASQFDGKNANNFDEEMVQKTCDSNELGVLPQQGIDIDEPSAIKFVDDLKVLEEDKSNSGGHSGNSELAHQVRQVTELPMVEDIKSTSIALKEHEAQQKDDATVSIVDEVAGADDKMAYSPINDINISPASDTYIANNLKRAAVSVLSAAAVKAKLLADEEDDQIRQLVSFVIEKELRKIETKLAFFPEMENLIGRAKEQTERARQKLINERTQIIAARLGLSQSSRPYAGSLANSRVAMGYSGLRMPGIAYQKPPPPRRY